MKRKLAFAKQPAPAISAPLIWTGESQARTRQLLSDAQRTRLRALGVLVRFKKGEQIYGHSDRAAWVYNIISGVVKAYPVAGRQQQISSFLFANDLFGLPHNGRYANSARAISTVRAWRFPAARLRHQLRADCDLEFHVICKLCDELRRAQRHAIIVGCKDATAKLALFLQYMEDLQANKDGTMTNEIYLQMSRTDIGSFVGLSLSAVSRGLRKLSEEGVIKIRDRRHVKVLERRALKRHSGPGTSQQFDAPAR